MSVKVEIVFNTLSEATHFLSKLAPPNVAAQEALPQQAPAAVNPMPAQIAQATAQKTTPETTIDPIKALRDAAASLIARMPVGEGPKKVRELLMAQGIAKFADANPQQATTLAAQMDAA